MCSISVIILLAALPVDTKALKADHSTDNQVKKSKRMFVKPWAGAAAGELVGTALLDPECEYQSVANLIAAGCGATIAIGRR